VAEGAAVRRPLLILPILALASCGPGTHGPRIGAADVADIATTAVGLGQGAVEMNPLVAAAGPANPVALLALKFGVKAALIKSGVKPAVANHGIETASAFAACSNIMTIAGATMPTALLGGVICAVVYFRGEKT
jgi:hypothetical protein